MTLNYRGINEGDTVILLDDRGLTSRHERIGTTFKVVGLSYDTDGEPVLALKCPHRKTVIRRYVYRYKKASLDDMVQL